MGIFLEWHDKQTKIIMGILISISFNNYIFIDNILIDEHNEPNKLKGKLLKKYYTYVPKVKASQKQYSCIEKSIFFNFSKFFIRFKKAIKITQFENSLKRSKKPFFLQYIG